MSKIKISNIFGDPVKSVVVFFCGDVEQRVLWENLGFIVGARETKDKKSVKHHITILAPCPECKKEHLLGEFLLSTRKKRENKVNVY